MKKIKLFLILLITFSFNSSDLFSINYQSHDYPSNKSLTKEGMKFLPISLDFRNYFMLQSIDNTTNIIIGDFVGANKILTLIIDKDSDEKIDKVIEYYPDTKKYSIPQKPSTSFFTNLIEIKKDIISGDIFKNNYAYNMMSINALKEQIQKGKDIFKSKNGYAVKIYDPDRPSTIMSEFFFNKNNFGGYDLIFTTYYYKIFKTKIVPVIYHSVYCKNSFDPFIGKTVEELLKLVAN